MGTRKKSSGGAAELSLRTRIPEVKQAAVPLKRDRKPWFQRYKRVDLRDNAPANCESRSLQNMNDLDHVLPQSVGRMDDHLLATDTV